MLWDLVSGSSEQRYVGHTGEVVTSQFVGEDETKVCSISTDATARLYQTETAQEVFICDNHQAEIVALQVDGSGNILVTGSFDKSLGVWDIRMEK